MEDVGAVTELFLIVVALYLFECIRWVGRGAVVLRSLVPGLWRFAAPWQVASQWKRAVALTAPWPPLGALHVLDGLPLYVGPRGVTLGGRVEVGWCLPGASAVFVPWAEVPKRLRFEETGLRLDGRTALILGTRRMTAALTRLFEEAGEAKSGAEVERALSRFLERRADLEEVRKRRARWRKVAWPHLLMCNLLLVTLFGAAWLLLFTGYFHLWREVLSAAGLVWVTTALAFDVAAVAALPRVARPTVGRRLAAMISPMSLVRSGDEVRAELYGDLEALAVGAIYLPSEDLAALGRRRLAELDFPLVPPEGLACAEAQEDEAWLRERLRASTVRLLGEAGLEAASLGAPLTPDAGSRSYCARCLSQYTSAGGDCSNCPGVPLLPFGAKGQAA